MPNEFIARNGITSLGNIIVSGSITSTGAINMSGSIASASFATTAATASSADNLLVRSTLTAQTLVVQTITSSVDFVTGSTRFGTLLSNTHVFSGSVTMNPNGLFVSSSGNVGVGTTSNINQRLTILDNNDAEALGIYRNFSAASDAGTYFRLGALNASNVPTPGAAIFGALESTKTSGYLSFFSYSGSAAAERMRITSAGRVGIGETTPVSALVVATTSDTGSIGQSGIVIEGSSTLTTGSVMALAFTAIPGTTRARAAVGSVVGSDWGKGNLVFYTRDASDSTALTTADEKMRITSGGNVGIGTTNPGYALEVSGNSKIGSSSSNGDTIIQSNSTPLQIRGRGAYDRPFVHLSWDVSPDSGVLMADTLRFNTGATLGTNTGTERIRITNSGSVGIGITNPAVTFNVGDPNHGIGIAYRGSSALPSIAGLFTDTGVSGGSGYGDLLVKARTDYGGYYGVNFYTAASDNVPVLRMRVQSDGVLNLLSGQLKFPATQNASSDANTLDDYEEGSFTPTSLGTNFSSISPIYGRYIKIGSQVSIACRWNVTPGSTGKRYVVFDLPFAFANNSNISFTGAVSNYNEASSAYSSNVGTSVRNSSSSLTQQYVEAVYISTTTDSTLLFSMTYFTFF